MPFDKTSCEIEFGGWSRSGWDVYYIESNPPISFASESTALTTFQEYSLDEGSSTATTVIYTYPCCPNEPWPVLQYNIGFERATNYYVMKIIVPNILFTFLSFAPFWIDVRSGERLSFGITILLAMVAVDIIAADLLPICPEYLFIEVRFRFDSIRFAWLCFAVHSPTRHASILASPIPSPLTPPHPPGPRRRFDPLRLLLSRRVLLRSILVFQE